VWWGPAPFKSSAARPWLIVTDKRRPFSHTECTVLALTTQTYDEEIRVPDDAWIEGGSDVQAAISPWYATTHKHRDLGDKQGRRRPPRLYDAARRVSGPHPCSVNHSGAPVYSAQQCSWQGWPRAFGIA